MSLAHDLAAALDPVVTFEAAFSVPALDWQRDYLRETRRTIVLKGRQVGASSAAAGLAIHVVRYRPAVNVVIVSPSLKQSTEIATKARLGLRTLGVRLVQDSAAMLGLANGSRIVSLPGTARSVRGWTASLLILDEAAFIPADTFTAARALVATGGRLVVQSTPADEAGDFYELVNDDDPSVARFTVRSDAVPTITPAFLAAERRSMSPDLYAQEYECEFGKAGSTLFSVDRISKLILDDPTQSTPMAS
jgi:hypothetical protein